MRAMSERAKTRGAVVMLAAAACVGWVQHASRHAAKYAQGIESVVGLALACAVLYLAGAFRFKSLNRTLPQLYADIRSGRRPPHTPAQRVCAVLALVLMWYFML